MDNKAMAISTPAWGVDLDSMYDDAEANATDGVWADNDRAVVEKEIARLGGEYTGSGCYCFPLQKVYFWNGYWYK